MTLKLKYRPRVPLYVQRYVHRALFEWIASFGYPRRLHVFVYPHSAVHACGKFGFGVFHYGKRSGTITVAAGLAAEVRKTGGDEHQAAMAVVEVLIHELIHYRQWCEHGRCWERGMVSETRRTMRSLGMTSSMRGVRRAVHRPSKPGSH